MERYFQFSLSHYLPPDLTHFILITQTKTAALFPKATVKLRHYNMAAIRRLFFFCRRAAD
jgi:hypothetical protein